MNPPPYTSAEIIQIIIALGTFATILGGVAVQIIMSIRNASKIDKVDEKVRGVNEKVDGAATASVTKIQGLQDEITKMVADTAAKEIKAAMAAQQPSAVVVTNTGDNPVPTTRS